MVDFKKYTVQTGCAVTWRRRHFPLFALMQCNFAMAGCKTDMWAPGPNRHTITLQRGRVQVRFPNNKARNFKAGQIIHCEARGTMTVTALEADTEWLCFHTQKLFGDDAPGRTIYDLDADGIQALPVSADHSLIACIAGSGFIGEAIMHRGNMAILGAKKRADIEAYKDASRWLHITPPKKDKAK